MKHDFPKTRVENFIEPAYAALCHWHCPVNDGGGLVKFVLEAWEIKCAACSPTGIMAAAFCLHREKLEQAYARCYNFL